MFPAQKRILSGLMGFSTLFIVWAMPAHAQEEVKVGVAVTIAPFAEFVEQIGGSRVRVVVMVPPSANEHTYEPTPEQLKTLSTAGLYIAAGSGIEFELAWLERFRQLNPAMRIENASKGVALMPSEDVYGHGHHHPHFDPHVWLSPPNVGIMARVITDALSEIDPDGREFYKENLEQYLSRLEELHRQIKTLLDDSPKKDFISAHSAWRYFAREYGLNEIAIEAEGKEPGASRLKEIIEIVKQKQIKTIFVMPQFSHRYAEVVAKEAGAKLIIADPLHKDYIENLLQFSKHLAGS